MEHVLSGECSQYAFGLEGVSVQFVGIALALLAEVDNKGVRGCAACGVRVCSVLGARGSAGCGVSACSVLGIEAGLY